MKPQTIYTEAAPEVLKEKDFIIATISVKHTDGEKLIEKKTDIRLVESQSFVLSGEHLIGLLRDAYEKGEEGKSFRNHLINLKLA
jgi:hypothetical protein